MLTTDEAKSLGILDSVRGSFTDLKTGNQMLIGDAVDLDLVEIEYDTEAIGKIINGFISLLRFFFLYDVFTGLSTLAPLSSPLKLWGYIPVLLTVMV